MAARWGRVAHPGPRGRQRTAWSRPIEQRALALNVEEMRFRGVDGQRKLFAQIARRHPLLKCGDEVLWLAFDRTEVDRAHSRGGLNDIDDTVNRVLRRD